MIKIFRTITLLTILLYFAKQYEPFIVWRIPFGAVRLPVLYWLVFLVYSYIFLKARNITWKGRVFYIISRGIVLDLIYSFIQSEGFRVLTGYLFEAPVYKSYYNAVYYSGMTVISLALAYLIRRCFFFKGKSPETGSEYIAVPFTAIFLVSLIHLARTNFWISVFFAAATGSFVLFSNLERPVSYLRKSYDSLLAWLYTNEKAVLILFFMAAVCIRLIYLLRTMSQPNYVATGADGALFDSHAWKIASGQTVTQAYTAGYFVFLAGLYKIFGHNYFAACFTQIILGAFVCIFIYDIIKQLTGNKGASYLGLFLATVNFSLIFSSISIGHQALDCFLLSFIAVIFVRYLKGLSLTWSIIALSVAALASGYSVAARESDLFVAAVLPLFIIIYRIKAKKIRIAIVESVLFITLFIIPIVPFLMRNMANLGVPYPVKYSEDASFPAEHTFSPEGSGNQKLIALGINPFTDPKGSVIAFLRRPGAASAAAAGSISAKFTALFLDQTYGTFDILFLIRRSGFYISAWFYAFLITVFGIIYMLRIHPRNGRMAVCLILSFIFLKTLPHLLISSRFGLRPPIDVFLLIAFSIGAAKLFSINGKDTVR